MYKYDPALIVREYNRHYKLAPHPIGLERLVSFINSDTELRGDERWVAYVLATIKHETAHKFLPIREIGRGAGKPYGVPHPLTRQVYYGRGYIQLTWFDNYSIFGKLLNVDLTHEPDLALNDAVSYQITSLGMQRGLFTGKALKDYFNDKVSKWEGARRIVNGQDKAKEIGNYAMRFWRDILPASRVDKKTKGYGEIPQGGTSDLRVP